MKPELIFIPTVKIHPSRIITYNETCWIHGRPFREKKEFGNTHLISVEEDGKLVLKRISDKFLNSSRQGNGVLSPAAKKRLKLALEYFLFLNSEKVTGSSKTSKKPGKNVTFITLTLPSKQQHTDLEIKKLCLNQFLIEISRYHKVTQYVWRAEYQENGNIHFHILTNKMIWWNDIRNRWNRIVNKLGYVDRYRQNLSEYHKNGFKVREDLLSTWSYEKQLAAYKTGLKTDWHNPNSIDVHRLSRISNVQAYLTKYMTKQEQEKTQEPLNSQLKKTEIGRTWGASVIISNIKGATSHIDSGIENNLRTLEEHFPNNIFKSDYFTIIDISPVILDLLHCDDLLHVFRDYILKEFNVSSQLTL